MESLLSRLGSEVRETLHHVTGLIGLVEEEPLSESQSRHLTRSRESADELLRTVNDLTELARPGATQNPVAGTPAAFALGDALVEIGDSMRTLAYRKGLTFDWMIDDAAPDRIAGDRDLIQDTLRRLIDNAIRFTNNGGVQLAVTSTQPAEEPEVVFLIRDSGPGISEAVLEALESPLTASPLEGLGLRIVKKRSAELGGSMSISTDGCGTIIRLSLPAGVLAARVLPEGCATAESAVAPDGHNPAPMRLLVAEDSDESFILIQAYSEAGGHHVVRALNGVLAVEMAKRCDYDLIVMDANMPIMDGYTATRMIRDWEARAGQARRTILLVSSDDLERQMQNGGAAGCSGYLTKPTTKGQILAALAYYTRPGSPGLGAIC